MQATKILPESYIQVGEFDLKKTNFFVLCAIQIAALLGFVFWGALFGYLLISVRVQGSLFDVTASSFSFIELMGLIVTLILVMLLHEAVHGFFFWFYTRSRPEFGVSLTYAFAAAPEWYIPRSQYLIIGLAPLVLISIVGLLLATVAPQIIALNIWLLISVNASGAIGDLLMTWYCLTKSRDILVCDTGTSITLYAPT